LALAASTRPSSPKLDRRLRLVDRGDLAGVVGGQQLARGDVGRELHHRHRPAVAAHHRAVGGLQPNLAAALGQAADLASLGLPVPQRLPQRAIGRRVPGARLQEQDMRLADDLGQLVAHHLQEQRVRRHDGAVHAELDHRLRRAERVQPRLRRGPAPRFHPTQHHALPGEPDARGRRISDETSTEAYAAS
jgi:hypothetical protein